MSCPVPIASVRSSATTTRRRAGASSEVVAEYQPLAEHLVQQALVRVGFACDADELRSAAAMGLLEAIARYDAERGIPFAAFAKHRIAGAILDELRAKDRLPRPTRQRARGLDRVREKLVRKLKREPTEAELARASGEDLETFRRREARERTHTVLRLEDLADGGWQELVADSGPTALEELCERERRGDLAAALERLPPRVQTVLSLYYREELSYREIGEVLGVTESRVCQIIKATHKKLREELA